MANNQIGTATNVTGPNIQQNNQTDTQQYFNNFFARDFSIGAANDVINAYFEKYTGSSKNGKMLAATVLYTAQAQGIDPMAILAEFQKLNKNQIDNYLAAFLNLNRVATSTIGIKKTQQTSIYISRSILP
jgi:hypothetical protein